MNTIQDGSAMDHDLRSRVVSLEHTVPANSQRITMLETWKSQKDISDAVRDTKFEGIREDLASIKGAISRLMWMFSGAFVLAIAGWIIQGGLKAL